MAGQHLLHMATQENNFYLRLHGLKGMLPFFFALNFSVQGQARYPSRIPIERIPRGKQTINRDAKTAGGIKFFCFG